MQERRRSQLPLSLRDSDHRVDKLALALVLLCSCSALSSLSLSSSHKEERSSMAARALTAAGRWMAGQTRPPPLLASCRSGAKNHSSASAQREEHSPAAAMTGAQVEAALNRKNVEVLQGEEEHVGTVLPDRHGTIGGALDGEEDASWVPDQDTGVFVPADADADAHGSGAHPATPHLYGGLTTDGSASVLDQAVFVREEDMEDVERPAMANANDNNTKQLA